MTQENDHGIIREELAPGRERSIAHLENLMVVVFDFNDGPMPEPDPPHSHPHEQITYVADGELNFFRGSAKYHLSRGDLITVPPGTSHCIQTLSKHTRLIDSFSPLRDDFLTGKK